jgi:hypothetical protein
MAIKKFQRTKEDFNCEQCGLLVRGNGYTNHCPKCLYSKHVDINPGDRQSECGGVMKPECVEIRGGKYIITHRCTVCGHKKRNKSCEDDDFGAIVLLTQRHD